MPDRECKFLVSTLVEDNCPNFSLETPLRGRLLTVKLSIGSPEATYANIIYNNVITNEYVYIYIYMCVCAIIIIIVSYYYKLLLFIILYIYISILRIQKNMLICWLEMCFLFVKDDESRVVTLGWWNLQIWTKSLRIMSSSILHGLQCFGNRFTIWLWRLHSHGLLMAHRNRWCSQRTKHPFMVGIFQPAM